jgi:hypothetical protein
MSSGFNASRISPWQLRSRIVITRRTFVNSGLLVSASAVGAIARSEDGEYAASLPSCADAPARLELAIFDSRFRNAREFGQAMARRSIATAAFPGDVTRIWYTRLDPTWRVRPVWIAGMTTHGALFCLERLAWDHGMRVVYRGTHRALAGGGTDHVLEASARRPQRLNDRITGIASWPADIASLIMSLSSPLPISPAKGSEVEQHRYRSRPRRNLAELQVPLFSWVIAPRLAIS